MSHKVSSRLSTLGLMLFIISVIVSFSLLILDAYWAIGDHITITEWSVSNVWPIYVIFITTLIGPLGLLIHFIFFIPKGGKV